MGKSVIFHIRNVPELMVILVSRGRATGSTYTEEGSAHIQVKNERPTKQVGYEFLTIAY